MNDSNLINQFDSQTFSLKQKRFETRMKSRISSENKKNLGSLSIQINQIMPIPVSHRLTSYKRRSMYNVQ